MPACLYRIISINIKHLKLSALFLLTPLFLFAQSLTGLWTGELRSDSATIRKDQSFEIALTENEGRVYGYSRSEFIVNDTLFFIVKKVTGTIQGDVCEVTDEEIVSYNFRGKLDKGIKVTSTFRRSKTDSTWYLDGTWKTNVTKKYYAITGKVGLQEEKDLNASKLFPHLEELNLAKDIAFYREYKDRKEEPVIVKVAHPEKIKTEYNDRPQPALINNDVAIVPAKPNLQKAEAVPGAAVPAEISNDIVIIDPPEKLHDETKPVADLQKTDTKIIPVTTTSVTPSPVSIKIAEAKKPEIIATADKPIPVTEKKEIRTSVKSEPVKPQPIAKTVVQPEKPIAKIQPLPAKKPDVSAKMSETKTVAINNPVTEKKEVEPILKPITPEVKKPAVDIIAKAAIIGGRKSEFSQVVNFKADSLELSLYDNGEIDGDTVSVFMNGEVLMPRQGLKASAIKKTIYITEANEEFTLVMFADNLGKYPPNTGLLVVHDGDDVYNLRFSSDFQKSSGIVFRRKK
jgi:hypothetical protein